ncbi:MAG: polyprenyl synthetase family protein [Halioglobus sp.]
MTPNYYAYQRQIKDRVNRMLVDLAVESPQLRVIVDEALDHISEASIYALTNGGKRIRSILVHAAARAVGLDQETAGLDHAACAIEMIHSYSLVHDDLPAMDNDDLRRGKPSCHRAFDEATAILVGDALQARAFELLAVAPEFSDRQRINLIRTLAAASGVNGMVGGQAIDIASLDEDLTLPQLKAMHALKTGALIRASVALGGIAADATEEQLGALDEYATHIGLAFQIVDDIIDVEGTTESLGKTQGKDEAANKPTYVKLLGLDGAKLEARRLLEAGLSPLEELGDRADNLRSLARYIVERSY